MKIFLSHHSRDKQTVKTFRGLLHRPLSTWIDDERLVWGDMLEDTFASTIKSDVDFLVVFLSKDTLHSEWVLKELNWALQRERELERTFVLPVLLPDAAPSSLPEQILGRKYLRLGSYEETSVEALAKEANEQLVRLLAESYSQTDDFIVKSYERVAEAKADIMNRMNKAEEMVKLVGVCLNFLHASEDFGVLDERARAGVKVTLCLANPDSPDIEKFKDYLYPYPPFGNCPSRTSVSNVWESLKCGKEQKHENVSVKLFDKPSTYSVVVFDTNIFVYPYGYQKLGDESPAFHFRKDGTNRSKFYLDIAESIIGASFELNQGVIDLWSKNTSLRVCAELAELLSARDNTFCS